MAPGCVTIFVKEKGPRRRYCGVHSARDPAWDRGDENATIASTHDALVERVAALLSQVGAALRVP